MEPMHADRYAPATTLPGLLQRGRGLGALMAAEDPAAAAGLVYGCIRREWRWDARADDRDLYLARLVRDLELPLGPVEELLAGDGDTRARAAGVLELLASGGPEPEAVSVPPGGPDGDGPDGAGPDVPALVAGLEQHWVDRAWCGPAALARGLARFGAEGAGAASLLRRFWLWTPHSYERADYLEALAAIGSAGTAGAYAESLWDCEARARLLGAAHAPDRPDVRARLAYLGNDPLESSEVRAAAGARLAELTREAFPEDGEAVRRGLE